MIPSTYVYNLQLVLDLIIQKEAFQLTVLVQTQQREISGTTNVVYPKFLAGYV
jgi:hypothetical protein